jgi:LacI family transcriptional regulator
MTGLVRRANPVTAIVSSSHGLTPLLLAGLAGAGIDLPVECSFVSYGDSDWARAYRPAISVVAADLYAAGRLLADAALSQLGHATGYDTDRLPIAQFIPRASVAPRQGQ